VHQLVKKQFWQRLVLTLSAYICALLVVGIVVNFPFLVASAGLPFCFYGFFGLFALFRIAWIFLARMHPLYFVGWSSPQVQHLGWFLWTSCIALYYVSQRIWHIWVLCGNKIQYVPSPSSFYIEATLLFSCMG